jgi:hypothetical protein
MEKNRSSFKLNRSFIIIFHLLLLTAFGMFSSHLNINFFHFIFKGRPPKRNNFLMCVNFGLNIIFFAAAVLLFFCLLILIEKAKRTAEKKCLMTFLLLLSFVFYYGHLKAFSTFWDCWWLVSRGIFIGLLLRKEVFYGRCVEMDCGEKNWNSWDSLQVFLFFLGVDEIFDEIIFSFLRISRNF